jgi:hypothetical protein
MSGASRSAVMDTGTSMEIGMGILLRTRGSASETASRLSNGLLVGLSVACREAGYNDMELC